jgi:hypothetical protein
MVYEVDIQEESDFLLRKAALCPKKRRKRDCVLVRSTAARSSSLSSGLSALQAPPRASGCRSASCQLRPISSQLAPTPSCLCESSLSYRFSGRCGSLFAVFGCVEVVPNLVLALWVFHASITRTRGKDFPKVLAPQVGLIMARRMLR